MACMFTVYLYFILKQKFLSLIKISVNKLEKYQLEIEISPCEHSYLFKYRYTDILDTDYLFIQI